MRLNNFLVQMLLISSLGPYIGFGLRLEHAAIYGLLFLFFFYSPKLIALNKRVFYLASSLLFAFIVTVFFDLLTGSKNRDGSVFSSIDNLCQPILLMVIYNTLLTNSMTEDAFKKYLKLIAYLGGFAASISIASMFVDLEFILKYFISGIDDEEGVWKQVLSLGRYTGFFAQPLEAGVYFSCCIFAITYLICVYQYKGFISYFLLALILVGGSISLSKNFYLLGLFSSIFLYASLANWTLKALLIRLSIFIGVISIMIFILANSEYGNYINSIWLMYQSEGGINAITAGRFGGGRTDVETLFINLWNEKPFTGFGMGSHLPLDNGYLEFAYQGGLFALLGYFIFLISGLIMSFINFKENSSKFIRILFIYIILSGVGGPVITCNRASILLIFLLTASLIMQSNSKKIVVHYNGAL